tara:strand:+ start:2760 stop:3266 length:507 start_codon:yes stop_codon:yes gene_type:complete
MHSPRALLLNSTYECIGFVDFKKAFKFLIKQKVDVLAEWDNVILFTGGTMKYPAVLRLKKHVAFHRRKMRFNRKNLFVRDKGKCQYCNVRLSACTFTIDHVIPKSAKGKTHWLNCVAACKSCNGNKANKLLHKSGLKLLKKLTIPYRTIKYELFFIENIHSDWNFYIT